ncbi:hypothetical protein V6N13_069670 [Hibiscus sabdariffa]|uniref:Uncharacterized protein n=1 Tax=Hibiscus sabdariffa TaxID=183260 RepID=A0ABR2PHF0_9ROSI
MKLSIPCCHALYNCLSLSLLPPITISDKAETSGNHVGAQEFTSKAAVEVQKQEKEQPFAEEGKEVEEADSEQGGCGSGGSFQGDG